MLLKDKKGKLRATFAVLKILTRGHFSFFPLDPSLEQNFEDFLWTVSSQENSKISTNFSFTSTIFPTWR